MFYGRSRDDEAVEVFLLHLVEEAVEGLHVLGWRVFADVRLQLHQVQFQRERTGGEQSDEVGFRLNLLGHEVEDGNSQHLAIWGRGSQHNAFLLQEFYCRQLFGDSNRHNRLLFRLQRYE